MSWSVAFARQARSDLQARERLLRDGSLPECHQLHYLQMACEKLAKAHLIAGGADPDLLQCSHAYIAKQLPIIARQFLAREAGRLSKNAWVVHAIARLARKIELLSPAVDDGGRIPANVEYPWKLASGAIIAPSDYDKFEMSMLHEKAGGTLLKVVWKANGELTDS